jgi:hypothetical protein
MLYRGYEIEGDRTAGFTWTDERGFIHNGKVDAAGGYKSEEDAMDDIDRYKRNLRASSQPAA